MRSPIPAFLAAAVVAIPLQVVAQDQPSVGDASVEDIYIARSWRESRVEPTPYCDAARTGFAGSLVEDRYTFHSVATRTTDGLVTDADAGTIGELHACFSPLPDDAASFDFYAEGTLAGVTFTGRGNCLSTRANPPSRASTDSAHFDLTNSAGYIGGQLATNTIVRALTAPAGTPDPPGYVQQSIATVRLWKRRDASGAAAYTKYCASCHDQVGARIPTRDALAEMSAARILRTLDFGLMMSIAYPMKRDEREAVAAFLGKGTDNAALPSARCAPDIRIMAGAAQASWAGWGPSQDNARYQTAERAGLGAADIPRLELKWAYGFAGDIIAFSAPTVVNGTLFVGSAGGAVQALDAETGCLHWLFQANGPVRTAMTVATAGAERALLFSDQNGGVYGVDAASGHLDKPRRSARGDAPDRLVRRARRRGVRAGGVVGRNPLDRSGVPVAAPSAAASRPSAYATDRSRGRRIWWTSRRRPAHRGGHDTFGPSGAGVWSAPTIDAARSVLYVTTGDNYSHPGTATSDAVMALDLKSGRVVWTRQTTPGDVYNSACGGRGPNCPAASGLDFDFGSSAILVRTPGGATCWSRGRSPAWSTASTRRSRAKCCGRRASAPAAPTAACRGMASDGRHVYAAVSDVGRQPGGIGGAGGRR